VLYWHTLNVTWTSWRLWMTTCNTICEIFAPVYVWHHKLPVANVAYACGFSIFKVVSRPNWHVQFFCHIEFDTQLTLLVTETSKRLVSQGFLRVAVSHKALWPTPAHQSVKMRNLVGLFAILLLSLNYWSCASHQMQRDDAFSNCNLLRHVQVLLGNPASNHSIITTRELDGMYSMCTRYST